MEEKASTAFVIDGEVATLCCGLVDEAVGRGKVSGAPQRVAVQTIKWLWLRLWLLLMLKLMSWLYGAAIGTL
ncbi:unnamed protein product [Ceratitis capitata]|uniref:(Mediterranean fruit fly) hypothetical protein n=1 Tax=Ceratitis capitata TaxID=7213 RepID=A0A811U6C2_CERCA|nr:unnamed protein product [Ceratitis capitata]